MKRIILIIAIISSVIAVILFLKQKDDIKILSHTSNDFGSVWVYEMSNIRCMSFSKPPSAIIQSCMHVEGQKIFGFHYIHMFLSSLFIKEQPRKILMLGMGGASIPKSLNILTPQTHIDIVEINPAIPPIVAKYFNFQENNKNRIFVEDAFDFVKKSPSDVYDIVFLDAFSPEYIPPHLLTDEFMQNIKKVLTKNGVIAINTLASSKFKKEEAELIEDNFGDYYSLSTNQNKVMIASKGYLPNLPEITDKANLWRYRFSYVGMSQIWLISLFQAQSGIK